MLAFSLNNEYSKNKRIANIIVGKLEEGANNEKCLVELGNVYFFSKYKVANNFVKAHECYRKGAEFYGNPTAHRMLGLIIEFELGVPENLPLVNALVFILILGNGALFSGR